MSACQVCRAQAVHNSIDFGPQPISNRFLQNRTDVEALFPLVLGECTSCGSVQLVGPPPASELRPRYSWITYNEPEGHLDALTEAISRLPGVDRHSRIMGLSFKDDSLLARFRAQGFSGTHRLDLPSDLDVPEAGAGVEMIQDRLTPERARLLVARHGRQRVILARHLIEHAQRLPDLLAAVPILLEPDGYAVIEVPDCSVCFDLCDYTTVWEERIHYFTPATFPLVFGQLGQTPVVMQSHPARPEGLLVGIGKATGARPDTPHPVQLSSFQTFSRKLPEVRRRAAERLKNQGPVAVLGAGHLACAFINYLELQDHVAFVVDDSPHKQGLFMPGSRLPIKGSASLLSEGIRLCLLSVNPAVEEKVIQRNQAFTDREGRFASIFAASARYFLA